MGAVVADPRSVAVSGRAAVGGYDHIKPLLLGQAAGLEDVRTMKYVALLNLATFALLPFSHRIV